MFPLPNSKRIGIVVNRSLKRLLDSTKTVSGKPGAVQSLRKGAIRRRKCVSPFANSKTVSRGEPRCHLPRDFSNDGLAAGPSTLPAAVEVFDDLIEAAILLLRKLVEGV